MGVSWPTLSLWHVRALAPSVLSLFREIPKVSRLLADGTYPKVVSEILSVQDLADVPSELVQNSQFGLYIIFGKGLRAGLTETDGRRTSKQ